MQRAQNGSSISSATPKAEAPRIDRETGWLLHPDPAAAGGFWVLADDAQTSARLTYGKQLRAACKAVGVVPVKRPGYGQRRWLTLADARKLVAAAGRSPPPAAAAKRDT